MNSSSLKETTSLDKVSTYEVEETGQHERIQMKRQIGLYGGIAMIVGTMIGSGIFISPGNMMKRTDSVAWSLILWTFCGMSCILMSFCYIELGCLIPKAGGEIAYFQAAYKPLHRYWGEIPAFSVTWVFSVLSNPAAIAINALAFGQYGIEPFINYGFIDEDWKDSPGYDWTIRVSAVVLTLIFTVLNILTVKGAERAQIALTVCKMVAIAIIIGVAIFNGVKYGKGSIPTEFDSSSASVSDFAIATYSGFFAFGGWQNLNYLMEELVDPQRNLPLAVFIGIPVVMTLYVIVNLSYLVVLSKEEIIASSAVAVDATKGTLGPMSFIIPLLVVLSVGAGNNAGQFAAGRIIYASSREGHLPSALMYVHPKFLSPVVGIIVNAIISIFFIIISNIGTLIELFGLVSWIFYAFAMVSVFILRYTKPDAVRPIRVPLIVPIISLVLSIILTLVPIIQQPTWNYLYVLLYSVVGVVLYTGFVYFKVRVPYWNRIFKKKTSGI